MELSLFSIAAIILWGWVWYKDPIVVETSFLGSETARNNAFKIWVDPTRTTWAVFAQEYYESKWICNPINMIKSLTKKGRAVRNLEGAALTYWLSPEEASLETLQTVYGYTWLTEKDWNKAVVKMAQYDTSKPLKLWDEINWSS